MIRLADDPRDISLFLSIRRSFGLSNEQAERKREIYLDDLTDRGGRACFLSFDEQGRAVGYVQLVWEGEEPGTAQVHDLRIKSSSQSRGWGRALVTRLELEAAVRGYHRLRLWVEKTNARAIGFYESLGYDIEGSEDGRGGILMIKSL